jgi:glycosyltransferase involved in cell wall biosynthesis
VSEPCPLRVVHVCCTDAFAGVERHVSELAAAQAAAGHQVTVIGGDQSRVGEVAGPDVRVLAGTTVLEALRSLRRLQSRPQILNVHLTAAEIAAGTAWWLRGVPVVSTRHIAAIRGARSLTRIAARAGARRLTRQIAVSQFVADHVDGPSTVVLSGVQPVEDRVPATDRRRVVLVAQRLEPEKETDVAIHAFARSELAGQGWRLEIAGSGSLHPAITSLARSLGIGQAVDMLGHRSDVWELMRSAAVLLAPDSDEAFGLSVVEAMARGLPVVASGAGAHLETVGSVRDAALFTPGNADAAARALRELATSTRAREVYGRLLQTTQRAHFTVAGQARRTEAVYRELL